MNLWRPLGDQVIASLHLVRHVSELPRRRSVYYVDDVTHGAC
jgi:hypothetical protein